MKEDMLEVLIYLFENYIADGAEFHPNQEMLTTELTNAGFEHGEINKAFIWLEELLVLCEQKADGAQNSNSSFRYYLPVELERIQPEGQSLLMRLEQAGVLDVRSREMVIDRLMALDIQDIDVENIKWVVMMVLSNQPGFSEIADWAEGLVIGEFDSVIH